MGNSGFYTYKLKTLLCAIALGMVPSKPWYGREDANGGYIVVKDDGNVVCFFLYNRNEFERYLLDCTRFERASTSRHGYMEVLKEGDEYYINLNLQIRFIKPGYVPRNKTVEMSLDDFRSSFRPEYREFAGASAPAKCFQIRPFLETMMPGTVPMMKIARMTSSIT